MSSDAREVHLESLRKAHLRLQELRVEKLHGLATKINSDFAYVLGAVLGDDYIYFHPNGGGHVRISVRDKDFAESFFEKLKS